MSSARLDRDRPFAVEHRVEREPVDLRESHVESVREGSSDRGARRSRAPGRRGTPRGAGGCFASRSKRPRDCLSPRRWLWRTFSATRSRSGRRSASYTIPTPSPRTPSTSKRSRRVIPAASGGIDGDDTRAIDPERSLRRLAGCTYLRRDEIGGTGLEVGRQSFARHAAHAPAASPRASSAT